MAAISRVGFTFATIATGTNVITFTPAVNDLIFVVGAYTANANQLTVTDNQGGVYVLVRGVGKNASADGMDILVRTAPIGQAISTQVTVTCSPPPTPNGGGAFVYKITGMNYFGPQAIRQSAGVTNQTAGTTPTLSLGSAVLTTNPCFGAVFNDTNPATMTPRTGWTEDQDIGYINPTTGYESMLINSGETASSIAWGSTSATEYCAAVIEFDATALPTPHNLAAQGAGK